MCAPKDPRGHMVHCPHLTDKDSRARERRGSTGRTRVVSSKAGISIQIIQPSLVPPEPSVEPCSAVTSQLRPHTSTHGAPTAPLLC